MKNTLFKSIVTLGVSTLFLSINVFATSKVDEVIAERIKPVGKVCIEGEECETATVAIAKSGESAGGRSGEEVYNTHCVTCHNAGVAGAPKLGDIQAWSSRIANGKDSVYNNAINGINAMPAKGACPNCSDDEIKSAVDYILSKSQ